VIIIDFISLYIQIMHRNLAQYPTITKSIQNRLTSTQGFASPSGVTLAASQFISKPKNGCHSQASPGRPSKPSGGFWKISKNSTSGKL